jgi:hypothetical protein
VVEYLAKIKPRLQPLYDFELMQAGGRLAGWLVDDLGIQQQVFQSLGALATPVGMQPADRLQPAGSPFLFAVGDGNHSLATAKAIWEEMKSSVSPDHPARYVLVEIVNLHDPALVFEPIHRVLFNVRRPLLDSLQQYFGSRLSWMAYDIQFDWDQMVASVNQAAPLPQEHTFGVLGRDQCGLVRISHPGSQLPVATLQGFLDHFMQQGGAEKIDYVHGDDVVKPLCLQANHVGFYLPSMPKHDLFRTVQFEGALPRKTFSMGEAHEKRYYMECRFISE